MKKLFSAKEIHPRDSFRRWQEAINDRIVPIDQTRLDDRRFEGMLEIANIGGLAITRITQCALRTDLTADIIRRRSKPAMVSVGIGLQGTGTANQDGRESVQRPGDISILDQRPAVLSSSSDSQCLFIELPRDQLEKVLGPTKLYTSLTIEAGQASTSLARNFLLELVQVHSRLAQATSERMVSIGVDLIVASIAERLAQEVPRTMQGTVLVQRAKAYVEANLADSTLDPPHLAVAMGVSLRRLQELFQERGQHISDWIWQRRLKVAASRLADPGYAYMQVGNLAYGCGFVSQAHFSRRFKSCFGMSPSEYRHVAISEISIKGSYLGKVYEAEVFESRPIQSDANSE